MLSIIFICLLIVPEITALHEGKWGVIAVCAVLQLLAAGLSSSMSEDNRARANARKYWANGGPEQYRKQPQVRNTKKGNAPASRERPRIRIDHLHLINADEHECSICGYRFRDNRMVCPHCGVRFTGRKDDWEKFDEEEDEWAAWDEEEGEG